MQDGNLVVSATRYADGWWSAGGINMNTAGDGHPITYGRVEFDARAEPGHGTTPAIMMWPTDNAHWPPEIDLLEIPHGNRDIGMVTNHYQGAGGNGDNQTEYQLFGADTAQWHHYTMDWTPEALDFYLDGQLVAHMPDHVPVEPLSFGVMMYVAAPNENWTGGEPDASTPPKVSTYVDNVKVWQWTGSGGAPTPATPAPTPVATTIGSGSDQLVVQLSQDSWQGDAQYTVAVDGNQQGGTLTASALHGAGQQDTLTINADWGMGSHKVEVSFLNDGWGGSAATDRNLYVEGASYEGATIGGATAFLNTAKTVGFTVTDSTPVPGSAPASVVATIGSGSDQLVLKISQDAWQGDAQYTISVDGMQVDGIQAAQALHALGQDDVLTVQGNWGSDAHSVQVNFLNDAYGGNPSTDRNLHVDAISYNGVGLPVGSATLFAAGPVNFGVPGATTGGGVQPTNGGKVIQGSSGSDQLAGTAGGDVITGGHGNDGLTGGAGADSFVLAQGDGPDWVTDFESGVDHVVFHGVDKATVTVSLTSFSGQGGLDVHYGPAGDEMFLAGAWKLAAGDFVFA